MVSFWQFTREGTSLPSHGLVAPSTAQGLVFIRDRIVVGHHLGRGMHENQKGRTLYRCIRDDVTEPGPPAAVGTELLRSPDTEKVNEEQSTHKLPVEIQTLQVSEKMVHPVSCDTWQCNEEYVLNS